MCRSCYTLAHCPWRRNGYALAQSFWAFVVAGALMGAFRALDSGPLEAWLVDTVHETTPGADVDRQLSRAGSILGGAIAVGAVLFTAAVVAVTAKLLVPDLPWAAAVALGAIVAPPDAVAAASVLKNFRIPKRIVTVLEGESLLNDASSLVLYRFAVAS